VLGRTRDGPKQNRSPVALRVSYLPARPDPNGDGETKCREKRSGIQLDGASDHGVSEALYLRDPDENGVELCWDRPRDKWPRLSDGRLQMFTRALDLQSLLAET
jgi:hypothetical protein